MWISIIPRNGLSRTSSKIIRVFIWSVCVCACTCAGVCGGVCVPVHVCVCGVCVHARAFVVVVCVYMCVWWYVWWCVCACGCSCMYIDVCMRVHIVNCGAGGRIQTCKAVLATIWRTAHIEKTTEYSTLNCIPASLKSFDALCRSFVHHIACQLWQLVPFGF